MMGKFFKIDWEMIKQIIGSFETQAQNTEKTMGKLRRMIDETRSEWIGEGATAFQNEMNSEVMPALKRLRDNLYMAHMKSKEIERLQHETENAIQALFKNILSQFGLGA